MAKRHIRHLTATWIIKMFFFSRTNSSIHNEAFKTLLTAQPSLPYEILFRDISQDLSSLAADSPSTQAVKNSSNYKFNLDLFFKNLHGKSYGTLFGYRHELPSTQDFMKSQGKCLPNGSVCLCDLQTKGRGRGDNVWTSPPGCLTFTVKSVLQQDQGVKLPLIQYVACLAIIRAVNEQGPEAKQLGAKIKWPNDIYITDKNKEKIKIGGILSESVSQGNNLSVLVGIGLNVDNSQPTSCLNDFMPSTNQIDREKLLASFLNHYENLMDELLIGSFDRIKQEYLSEWLHTDQSVQLAQENNLEVKIKSISSSTGALIAKDAKDNTYELYPDGNRLDFFKGLLSRKI